MNKLKVHFNRSVWKIVGIVWPLVLIVIVWESLVQLNVLNRDILPPPSALAFTILELIRSGVLFINMMGSLIRVLIGFGIAVLLGINSGLVLGTFPRVGQRIVPLFDLIRPIPPIAWIPIAILWFGLGNQSAIFIVVIGAFFPIFLNTYNGVRLVNQNYINMARCLGANTRLIMSDILFPAALPQIITGLRVGIGMAWMSVIAAEMIGAREGLGYAIQLNRTMLETEAVLVNMIVIGLMGWAMNYFIIYLEQWATCWNQNTLAAHHANTGNGF